MFDDVALLQKGMAGCFGGGKTRLRVLNVFFSSIV